jgi:hypothetical protein
MVADSQVKTLNGRPTKVSELALPCAQAEADIQPSFLGRVNRAYKNLNLILAGMYTGVTCYGVPHEKHTYKASDTDEKSKD